MMTYLVLIGTFLFMEFAAWFAHKYLMHGFLWNLHEDHHVQDKGFFQKNDAFFLIFAVPSFLCIFLGMLNGSSYVHLIGFGIALYGFAYFFVHDVYIHQRFFKTNHWKIPILLPMKKAHILHHNNTKKEHGEYFGLLFSPLEYLFKSKK